MRVCIDYPTDPANLANLVATNFTAVMMHASKQLHNSTLLRIYRVFIMLSPWILHDRFVCAKLPTHLFTPIWYLLTPTPQQSIISSFMWGWVDWLTALSLHMHWPIRPKMTSALHWLVPGFCTVVEKSVLWFARMLATLQVRFKFTHTYILLLLPAVMFAV